MSSCNYLLLDRLEGIAGEILKCVEIGWGSDVVEDSEVAANIAYAASTLGSFNAKPSVAYLSVAKHIMHYFKHSAKLGVTCKRSDLSSLTGYTDANFFHSGSATVNIGYVF
ncbi:hypothetical protein IWW39_004609 [Coemansia spiralis]|uniref:Uncharacterized protein n=1 Tax=Coemansia spiralis TaxID=417178 RepID=A0A9W8GFQ0_9FUNG|nr:hypothetical protein IWW39_004609 [Coemansia spiralis]